MIVRLTHVQARAIEIRMPELYGASMREHRTTYGRTQHDYDMPAIAWRRILDGMVSQCYGPAGGKLKGQGRPSDSALLAIKRVAEAVKRIEGHPALRSASVEGWVADVIPAWQPMLRHFPEIARSPYPTWDIPTHQRWTFVLLLPTHSENLGMKVTTWRQIESMLKISDASSWTFSEESHLLFSRSPAPS